MDVIQVKKEKNMSKILAQLPSLIDRPNTLKELLYFEIKQDFSFEDYGRYLNTRKHGHGKEM